MLKTLLAFLLIGQSAFGFITTNQKYLLNNKFGAGLPAQIGLGTLLNNNKNAVKATYDFSLYGGAVGDIALPVTLPSGAVIERVLLSVVTALTSGGSATVAVKAQSAADLYAATAYGSVTGLLEGVPVGTAATSIKLTAARVVYVTVAVAALTAGKFDVFVEYYL